MAEEFVEVVPSPVASWQLHTRKDEDLEYYTELAINETERWIRAVTRREFKYLDDPRKSLEDGILLCELAKALKPGCIKKINKLPTPFAGLDNLNVFLTACEEQFGLQSSKLFNVNDLEDLTKRAISDSEEELLVESDKRLRNVAKTIFWLGKSVKSWWKGPQLDLSAFCELVSYNRDSGLYTSPPVSARQSVYSEGADSGHFESPRSATEQLYSELTDSVHSDSTGYNKSEFEDLVIKPSTSFSHSSAYESLQSDPRSPVDEWDLGLKPPEEFGSNTEPKQELDYVDRSREQDPEYRYDISLAEVPTEFLDNSKHTSEDFELYGSKQIQQRDQEVPEDQEKFINFKHSETLEYPLTSVTRDANAEKEYPHGNLEQDNYNMPGIHNGGKVPGAGGVSGTYYEEYYEDDEHEEYEDDDDDNLLAAQEEKHRAEAYNNFRFSQNAHAHTESLDSTGNQSTGSVGSNEYVPTSRLGSRKSNAATAHPNPLQYVAPKEKPLSEEAKETIQVMEKQKKEVKDFQNMEDDWQSNLSSWKNKMRRKSQSACPRALESETVAAQEEEAKQKKNKTFKEIMESRGDRKKGSFNIYPFGEDEDDEIFRASDERKPEQERVSAESVPSLNSEPEWAKPSPVPQPRERGQSEKSSFSSKGSGHFDNNNEFKSFNPNVYYEEDQPRRSNSSGRNWESKWNSNNQDDRQSSSSSRDKEERQSNAYSSIRSSFENKEEEVTLRQSKTSPEDRRSTNFDAIMHTFKSSNDLDNADEDESRPSRTRTHFEKGNDFSSVRTSFEKQDSGSGIKRRTINIEEDLERDSSVTISQMSQQFDNTIKSHRESQKLYEKKTPPPQQRVRPQENISPTSYSTNSSSPKSPNQGYGGTERPVNPALVKNRPEPSTEEPAKKNFVEKTIKMNQKPNHQKGFGFSIKGGKEQGTPIVVEKVRLGSVADVCELEQGDEIVTINGAEVANHFQGSVMHVINQAVKTGGLELKIKRVASDKSQGEEDDFSDFEDEFEAEMEREKREETRRIEGMARRASPEDDFDSEEEKMERKIMEDMEREEREEQEMERRHQKQLEEEEKDRRNRQEQVKHTWQPEKRSNELHRAVSSDNEEAPPLPSEPPPLPNWGTFPGQENATSPDFTFLEQNKPEARDENEQDLDTTVKLRTDILRKKSEFLGLKVEDTEEYKKFQEEKERESRHKEENVWKKIETMDTFSSMSPAKYEADPLSPPPPTTPVRTLWSQVEAPTSGYGNRVGTGGYNFQNDFDLEEQEKAIIANLEKEENERQREEMEHKKKEAKYDADQARLRQQWEEDQKRVKKGDEERRKREEEILEKERAKERELKKLQVEWEERERRRREEERKQHAEEERLRQEELRKQKYLPSKQEPYSFTEGMMNSNYTIPPSDKRQDILRQIEIDKKRLEQEEEERNLVERERERARLEEERLREQERRERARIEEERQREQERREKARLEQEQEMRRKQEERDAYWLQEKEEQLRREEMSNLEKTVPNSGSDKTDINPDAVSRLEERIRREAEKVRLEREQLLKEKDEQIKLWGMYKDNKNSPYTSQENELNSNTPLRVEVGRPGYTTGEVAIKQVASPSYQKPDLINANANETKNYQKPDPHSYGDNRSVQPRYQQNQYQQKASSLSPQQRPEQPTFQIEVQTNPGRIVSVQKNSSPYNTPNHQMYGAPHDSRAGDYNPMPLSPRQPPPVAKKPQPAIAKKPLNFRKDQPIPPKPSLRQEMMNRQDYMESSKLPTGVMARNSGDFSNYPIRRQDDYMKRGEVGATPRKPVPAPVNNYENYGFQNQGHQPQHAREMSPAYRSSRERESSPGSYQPARSSRERESSPGYYQGRSSNERESSPAFYNPMRSSRERESSPLYPNGGRESSPAMMSREEVLRATRQPAPGGYLRNEDMRYTDAEQKAQNRLSWRDEAVAQPITKQALHSLNNAPKAKVRQDWVVEEEQRRHREEPRKSRHAEIMRSQFENPSQQHWVVEEAERRRKADQDGKERLQKLQNRPAQVQLSGAYLQQQQIRAADQNYRQSHDPRDNGGQSSQPYRPPTHVMEHVEKPDVYGSKPSRPIPDSIKQTLIGRVTSPKSPPLPPQGGSPASGYPYNPYTSSQYNYQSGYHEEGPFHYDQNVPYTGQRNSLATQQPPPTYANVPSYYANPQPTGGQPPAKPPRVHVGAQPSGPMHAEPMVSVSGRQRCSHCDKELGQGAAMIIESLNLYYHVECFRCCVCHTTLGTGQAGADVRVRGSKLHCQNCYSNDEVGLKYSRV